MPDTRPSIAAERDAEIAAVTPLDAIADAQVRAYVRALRQDNAVADPTRWLPDVPPQRIPQHVAFIMDGNGRWATARGLHRAMGHKAGAEAVRRVVEHAGRLGVRYVTLYSFSIENWRRPAEEVQHLMELYVHYMAGERDRLVANNVRLMQIGRREGLPDAALAALDATIQATSCCTGPTLILAVNYSGRAEITDAVRSIARDAARGGLDPAAIDESLVASRLYTAGVPDPDLLVRTAGEMRVSNYLLWQISYTELFVCETLWPDFSAEEFNAAVRSFASRDRRFGGLPRPSA